MLNFFVAIIVGKFIIFILSLRRGEGTALPGLIAEKIAPKFLSFARNYYNGCIIITGTNGKTSTQTLLAHTLRRLTNQEILVNSRGANLKRGLIAEFIKNYSFFGKKSNWPLAIWEVEEATLPRIIKELRPDYLVVTNFFRDQLDAYGEVERTKQHIANAINEYPEVTIITNYDDPQCHELLSATGSQDTALTVSIAKHSEFIDYEPGKLIADLKPTLQLDLPKLNTNFQAYFDWLKLPISLKLPGYHSCYSFLFTALLAQEIYPNLVGGISFSEAINSCPPAFGRGELISNKQLFLIKNPVGFDLTLDLLASTKEPINLAILINDNIADGRDVSWLWDSRIEKLADLNLENIYLGGTRAEDMNLRIKYAAHKLMSKVKLIKNENMLASALDLVPNVKVLVTYTALLSFRRKLLAGDQDKTLSKQPRVNINSAE